MLILSRRAEEQIMFPHLGIRINVLQVKGQLVKLGVDAPKSVRVLRSELPDNSEPLPEPDLTHDQRNALNLLHLKIHAIQARVERGEQVSAQEVLNSLVERYSAMDHSLNTTACDAALDGREQPIRVLVVEDCDNERQLMAYLLASHGFDVQVAPDGLIALAQLRQSLKLPDFVLMDMQMPNSDGLETLLEIRSCDQLRGLKVFAVTGVERNTQHEPIGHGWDGWFRKPLDVNALVRRLQADSAPAGAPAGV